MIIMIIMDYIQNIEVIRIRKLQTKYEFDIDLNFENILF